MSANNDNAIIVRNSDKPIHHAGMAAVPTLFAEAGEKAAHRFIEFFTANIRNRHTRDQYSRQLVARRTLSI